MLLPSDLPFAIAGARGSRPCCRCEERRLRRYEYQSRFIFVTLSLSKGDVLIVTPAEEPVSSPEYDICTTLLRLRQVLDGFSRRDLTLWVAGRSHSGQSNDRPSQDQPELIEKNNPDWTDLYPVISGAGFPLGGGNDRRGHDRISERRVERSRNPTSLSSA